MFWSARRWGRRSGIRSFRCSGSELPPAFDTIHGTAPCCHGSVGIVIGYNHLWSRTSQSEPRQHGAVPWTESVELLGVDLDDVAVRIEDIDLGKAGHRARIRDHFHQIQGRGALVIAL